MAELSAGTYTSMSGSMAEAMLAAMDEALAEAGRPGMTDSARPGMQIMFLAISKGLVRHLKANEHAFHVDLPGTNQRLSVTLEARG